MGSAPGQAAELRDAAALPDPGRGLRLDDRRTLGTGMASMPEHAGALALLLASGARHCGTRVELFVDGGLP